MHSRRNRSQRDATGAAGGGWLLGKQSAEAAMFNVTGFFMLSILCCHILSAGTVHLPDAVP